MFARAFDSMLTQSLESHVCREATGVAPRTTGHGSDRPRAKCAHRCSLRGPLFVQNCSVAALATCHRFCGCTVSAHPPRTSRSAGPGDESPHVPTQETACMHAYHRVSERVSAACGPVLTKVCRSRAGQCRFAFTDAHTTTTASWLTLSPRQ